MFLFPILISFDSYGGLFDICIETDAQDRNGIFYLPNETKPFTGNKLCEYENGKIKTEGNLKDGKKDGKWTAWYENGQIKAEANYKDGKGNGKWIAWLVPDPVVSQSTPFYWLSLLG